MAVKDLASLKRYFSKPDFFGKIEISLSIFAKTFLTLALFFLTAYKASALEDSDYTEQVQAMYIAYYSRPGDPGGVAYWAKRLVQSNGDSSAIINQFGNSAEYTDRLAGKDSEELINNIFVNLFGRDADAGGLVFYKNKLESGAITLASIALNISNGVSAGSNDAAIVGNKIDVATAYTTYIDETSAEYGEQQIDQAVTLIAGITSNQEATAEAISNLEGTLANTPATAEVPAPAPTPAPTPTATPTRTSEPAPATVPTLTARSISVSWSIPDSRENGDTLYSYEIGGYEILYKRDGEALYTSEIIANSQTTSIDIPDLLAGEYLVKIASFDTDNLLSEYQTVTVLLN